MSFRFAGSYFGQPPSLDTSATVSPFESTRPSSGSSSGRDLTYGGAVKRGAGSGGANKKTSESDVKKAQAELAKAESARAQVGIKRFFDDVIAQQFRWKSVRDAKAALDATGELSAERTRRKEVYEKAVADKMRQLMRAFARHEGWSVGYVNPPSIIGNHDNRFNKFVLAPKLADTLRKGPYGSWIKTFDPDAFKAVTEDINNNIGNSKAFNSEEIKLFDSFPPTDKLEFFRAAVTGIGFPAADFSADRVQEMGPGAYQSFTSGGKFSEVTAAPVELMVGTRLADVYSVPSADVQRLRKQLAILQQGTAYTAELYDGPSQPAVDRTAFEKARKDRQEAARQKENARKEAREALRKAQEAEAARKKAEAEGKAADEARLAKEKSDAEQALRDAEAKAADAERRAREAEQKLREATGPSTSGGASGGGEVAPFTPPSGGGGGGVAPAPGESAPTVVADDQGGTAIVVPDASVVPVVPEAPAPKAVSPVVLLLAAAAIGGGIWWFSRRRGE